MHRSCKHDKNFTEKDGQIMSSYHFTSTHSKPFLLIIFSGLFSITACSPPEFEAPKKAKPLQRTYSVSLPPSIDLDSEIPPLKHSDGTFRVDGLTMQARKFLDTSLSVTGYVTEISPCSNKAGDTCAKPYLWIADHVGELDVRLRIADMERRLLRRFKVGKKYNFTGEFSQTSKSGYANSRGILRLTKFKKIR